MAIQRNYNYKGLNVSNAYYKVSKIVLSSGLKAIPSTVEVPFEDEIDGVLTQTTRTETVYTYEKFYIANFDVEIYTDSTKENVLESFNHSVEVEGPEVDYSTVYTELKRMYPEAIDC